MSEEEQVELFEEPALDAYCHCCGLEVNKSELDEENYCKRCQNETADPEGSIYGTTCLALIGLNDEKFL